MSSVFISYRRSDSVQVTGRIYDKLVVAYGKENIFKDVDSIPLGTDFRQSIEASVARCDVMLVVVGKTWLNTTDPNNRRRLDDPADFVRIEVESALKRGIRIIPLLLDDATMPSPDELPPSLKEFAYRNGTKIRPDPDFHPDMDRVLQAIVQCLPVAGEDMTRPTNTGHAPARKTLGPAPDSGVRQEVSHRPLHDHKRTVLGSESNALAGGALIPQLATTATQSHATPRSRKTKEENAKPSSDRVRAPKPGGARRWLVLLCAVAALVVGGIVVSAVSNRPSRSDPPPSPATERKPPIPTVDARTQEAEKWFQRGTRFLQTRDYDQAIDAFSKAIGLNSEYAEAYYYRSLAHEGNRDTLSSQADKAVAFRLKPSLRDKQK
ncbi:MAG TPA: TIR domain-containing protein [Gemmataceae bacterium]|nr:TIR domain-containing protein [Gemmataceae bacterium]